MKQLLSGLNVFLLGFQTFQGSQGLVIYPRQPDMQKTILLEILSLSLLLRQSHKEF